MDCGEARLARISCFAADQYAQTVHMNLRIDPQSSIVAGKDDDLLEEIQRQSFRYFWDGAHPASGLARDRSGRTADPKNDLVAIGGSGFGMMAIIIGVERGWIDRTQATTRLDRMLTALEGARRYDGVFPHFINGTDGSTVPFSRLDDGGDLVETSLLMQGLICARQYFSGDCNDEVDIRSRIDGLWREVRWTSHIKSGERVLYWHRSPRHGFRRNVPVRGWNEALITYLLAAASPTAAIDPIIYHEGFAANGALRNGQSFYGVKLPLGPDFGGPLFFAHYSFCGLDPRGLVDRYADYWEQNVAHCRINYNHSVQAGHAPFCWGLTSSHGPKGYSVGSPATDNGVIAPTAALSSMPYLPEESLQALRYFLSLPRGRIGGRFGFVDAFAPSLNWFARTYLAIDQGPIIAMIENYRSGLLWRLFMSAAEIRGALAELEFDSPHLGKAQGTKSGLDHCSCPG